MRVKLSVPVPRYNWGKVRPGEVGVITMMGGGHHGSTLYVNFPSQKNWAGVEEEMERVPAPW